MKIIYVQWTDAWAVKILSVFGCQQDAALYPNQAQVPSSDERYASYYATLPSMMQSVMAAPGS